MDRRRLLMTPRFTSDWFTWLVPSWKAHVVPRIHSIPNAQWLEIGSYEGRSALWTLEHVLNPTSKITCIDIWGLKPHPYEKTFNSYLASYTKRLTKLKGNSRDILKTLPSESFHGAYVDGSHDESEVLHDAIETWRLTKPGAVIVFDDYASTEYPGVQLALDTFLKQPDIHFEILHKEWQVILLKK